MHFQWRWPVHKLNLKPQCEEMMLKEILIGAVKVVFTFLGAGCAAMGPMIKNGHIDEQSIVTAIGAGSVAVVALYMRSPRE